MGRGSERNAWIYSAGFTDSSWDDIAIIRFQLYSKNVGDAVVMVIDDVRAITSKHSQGAVTFCFDDGRGSVFTLAKPLLDAYNYPAVAFIITSRVGTNGYMTLNNLLDMQSAGWDISSHTKNHIDLTVQNNQTIMTELKDSKNWLIDNGFLKGARFFANPFYRTNPTVQELVSQYYLMSRPYSARYETIPAGNQYNIRTYATANTTTSADVISAINNAVTYGSWAVITMHIITTGDLSQETYMTAATLKTILDYCYANEVSIKTFSDIYDDFSTDEEEQPSPTATPTPTPTGKPKKKDKTS